MLLYQKNCDSLIVMHDNVIVKSLTIDDLSNLVLTKGLLPKNLLV